VSLVEGRRPNKQLRLAFAGGGEGDALLFEVKGVETDMAAYGSEGPVEAVRGEMEAVCDSENLKRAFRQVVGNKGSAGVDGMSVDQLRDYLKAHWPEIREQLLSGTYRPKPVRRVEIPKADGGKRKLGIPTVLDRLIRQAILQELTPEWDKTFSTHSYGFRPGRRVHQAINQAQAYIAEGRAWVASWLSLTRMPARALPDCLAMLPRQMIKSSNRPQVSNLAFGSCNTWFLPGFWV